MNLGTTACLAAGLLAAATIPAAADQRGQDVCGVPADEAALITAHDEKGSGYWGYYTPNTRKLDLASSEQGAIGSWQAHYVCDVTLSSEDLAAGAVGRFYWVRRKLRTDEFDVRKIIVGAGDSKVETRRYEIYNGYCEGPFLGDSKHGLHRCESTGEGYEGDWMEIPYVMGRKHGVLVFSQQNVVGRELWEEGRMKERLD